MSTIYATQVKTARMTATRDHFANGTLEILSAADAVLAIFGLDADGGTVSTDTWTLVFDSDTVAGTAAAGTGTDATKAQIKTAGGDAHITGLTVGLTGTDIVLNNVNIAEAQEVELTAAQFQHAPNPA